MKHANMIRVIPPNFSKLSDELLQIGVSFAIKDPIQAVEWYLFFGSDPRVFRPDC